MLDGEVDVAAAMAVPNAGGETALHKAVRQGQVETVRLILDFCGGLFPIVMGCRLFFWERGGGCGGSDVGHLPAAG